MIIDKSVSAVDFNYDIDYKLEGVVISNSMTLSNKARANLRAHVMDSGAGAGAIFVNQLSQTNIKQGMKFPEPVTTILRVSQRGGIMICARGPDVEYLIQYHVDTDGRLATVGSAGWKDFVDEVALKKNQVIYVLIFKEVARLVVCVKGI